MNPLLRPFYLSAGSLATAIVPLTVAMPFGEASKLVRTFRARRGVVERWEALARGRRDRSRPLVWFHAPSVGEGLQARSVVHALREVHPEYQVAYSWFSPSAEAFASSIGADMADCLPFDTVDSSERLLTALAPSVIAFSKLDIWPILVERAQARGIPVVLVSGTIARSSGRRGLMARAGLGDAYRALTAVGAIDEANAERLIELGVRREAIRITGDTRFDQVWQRSAQTDRELPLLQALESEAPTLVAGSTWPSDEAVLLPMWEETLTRFPGCRLIIAPHEPTQAHLEPLLSWARSVASNAVTLSSLEQNLDTSVVPGAATTTPVGRLSGEPDLVIVDRVGVLGDLYSLATAAFVGGGFHAAGLHSVIEPAAFGVPVMFGPRYQMSREAELLLGAGGASAGDKDTLLNTLSLWISSPSAREAAGASARKVVQEGLGATLRSLDLLLSTQRWPVYPSRS